MEKDSRELDSPLSQMLPLCAHFILQKPQGYDYFLGGKDHFAADRAASEAMLKIYSETGNTHEVM